jgi:hypothetical protein
VESEHLAAFVIPGRALARTRNLEIPDLVRFKSGEHILTKTGRGLIAAPMNNAATILIARRRRIFAVPADICV